MKMLLVVTIEDDIIVSDDPLPVSCY